MKTRFILPVILFSTAAFAETKNDNALYDPTPPADSAFVRVINAMPGEAVKAGFGGASFGSVASPGISEYRVIKAGEQTLSAGAMHQKIKVESGKYYSLALLPEGKETTFEDAPMEKPSKAYLYLYNLSDAPKAGLVATQQKVDVISDIAPGKSGSKEINALTLDLAVNADGAPVQNFTSVALKRRAGFSFLLTGSGASRKAINAENHVKP